jgi:serine/threonine-protein kinase
LPLEQQRRVRELFDAALDHPSGQRSQFLAAACQGDLELQRAVERLLKANDRAGILDTPLRQRVDTPSAPIPAGAFIGNYKILQELSSGGMGIVYQAVRADEVFQRICAIKVIRPELSSSWLVEKFRQERKILGRLDHVNIARILDGGSTPEGLPYFVMDYVDGPPIHKFCAHHALTVRQRLALFQQACAAVHYIHQNGLIHSDLKPSNILVGHDGTVKLVDFGIASVLAESSLSQPAPANLSLLMTPCYASPEQLAREPLTPSSDIYALGVILYELLAGAPPFSPDTIENTPIEERFRQLKPPSQTQTPDPSLPAPPPRQHRPARRAELDSIVLKAMQRQPEQRYSSAAALADDLARYLQNRPVSSYRRGLFYRSRKLLARQRLAAIVLPLMLLLLSASVWQAIELRKRYERARFLEDEVRLLQARIDQSQKVYSGGSGAPGLPSEKQLHDIADIAGAYRKDFVESVRLWPGLSRKRRELLAQTERILRDAETYTAQSPAAQSQLAFAWMELANLEGNPRTINLHDPASAAASIREAVRLISAVPDASPDLVRQIQTAAAQIGKGQ